MKYAALLLLAMVMTVSAEKQVVVAKKDNTKVYQNQVRQLYENPIYTAKKDEYMEVVESDRNLFKVRLSNGKTGWVEKQLVSTENKGKKDMNYVFEETEVQGWLDNPQAVYILDMTDPNFKPIKLDKSFSDNLEENVDREQSEEQHGMYRPNTEVKK
ncbi:MAG: hypothetical protein A2293_12580 [Elusimicrobia bacterium RIFOXYB2_FULL_49_7]|nr:MAG: hypothetical protein A2293_12580 [Elusimicrobia bacterium RIFOXYB2_FULL_49_7]